MSKHLTDKAIKEYTRYDHPPKTDLTGVRCGKLEVIKFIGYKETKTDTYKHVYDMWECKCDCGNNYTCPGIFIRNNRVKSCGCAKKKDLTGLRFGKLVVIDYAGKNDTGKIMWNCRCDCGNYRIVRSDVLVRGEAISCKECAKERYRELVTKHGLSHSRLYKLFRNIITRCYNPHAENYILYGGRGIRICDYWYTPEDISIGFMRFYNWAITHGYHDPLPGEPKIEWLTIERQNVNGDYEPDNCCWITMREQQRNKRTNKYIFDGEEVLTYSEMSRKYNITNTYLSYLIKEHGADIAIHRAKTGELLKRDKNGDIRDKDGFLRLIKHYS